MASRFGRTTTAAMGGLGRLAASLGGGQQTEDQAFQGAQLNMSKLAQALAVARQADAAARENDAQAGKFQAESDAIKSRPGLREEQAALASGTDLPLVRAIRQQIQTGQAPQVDLHGPATPEGGQLTGPMQIDPGQRAAIMLELYRSLPVQTGDNPEQFAKASGEYQNQDLMASLLAGQRQPGAVGAAQAAMSGKPLYHADATGSVLDLFGGGLNTANPMAGSTIALRKDQAGQARAGAAENLAQAAAAGARAGAVGVAGAGAAVPPPKPLKPMPPVAVKIQNEEVGAIGTFAGLDADLASMEKQITDGKLKFGPVRNIANTARNYVGASDEESRNLATFKTKLEGMRNAILLLNKGVQTEGDAQRAMSEIMKNINDPGVVKQRLAELRATNRRAVDLRRNSVDLLRSNYGHDPMDFSKFDQQPAAVGAAESSSSAVEDALKKYK